MSNHPNRAATYTVLNRHGCVQERCCTLYQAAQIVLGYDGHTHEIRPAPDGKGFDLWTSNVSRNSSAYNGLTKTVIFSIAEGEQLGHADIYRQVIRHADWFNGCEVMTDAAYDEMQNELNLSK
jgi:hypothetical protein